ncbi:MAG: DUF3293 domain-containing protein [Proteobacteria bacterium]|nr:DUF3293 domain-containing protein [Pseudomonadota bacterium]NBY20623.1 DUF3293 domain-containing protein [bacterium]
MSQDLQKAYHEALYKVHTPQNNLILKVGERNQDLIDLLMQNKTEEWAYITASNPQSKLLSDEENRNRNEHLHSILRREKYLYFDGEGCSQDGSWPAEKSYLILGISEKDAIHLARQFNQAGILIGTSSGVPVLRLLD